MGTVDELLVQDGRLASATVSPSRRYVYVARLTALAVGGIIAAYSFLAKDRVDTLMVVPEE